MSYCRWSSDNFRCDLYCYQDCDGGFTTHVAGRTKLFTIIPSRYSPLGIRLFYMGKIGSFLWVIWGRVWNFVFDLTPWKSVRPPYAGMTFYDNDLESFRVRLLDLRAKGYRFPDRVIARVDRELEEERKAKP